jgi:hypothetical protein
MLVLHYRAIPDLRRHVETTKASAPPRPGLTHALRGSSASQTTKCRWCRQITRRRRPAPDVGTNGR